MPRALRLRGNLEHDDALARGAALACEPDAPSAVLLREVGLVPAGRLEELTAATDQDPALPACSSTGAEILEPDPAPVRGVQQILPNPDARSATLRLEDGDGLGQATREARDPT